MSKKITITILSISLLTVMAGAAVAPALGVIQEQFSQSPAMLIRLIVSMPALFIILVNLSFTHITRILRTRTIALIGLTMYIVCGVGAFLAKEIITLLILRAMLGMSVGLIMPLSTGLLAYYNPPEKMAGLMGLSAAMNQLGGVIATLLAGYLATISWNYTFLVYSLGLIAVVLVVLFLPNEKLRVETKRTSTRFIIWHFHPSIIGMLLCMGLFFVFVTNFAITESTHFSTMEITYLMMAVDVIALIAGMLFGRMMKALAKQMKYIPPVVYIIAYAMLSAEIPADIKDYTTLVALLLIGIANGIGIPYLNTIASIKGGKDSVTTVMPLLSASLYLGQFISPVIVGSLTTLLFGLDQLACYKIALAFAVIYLLQVYGTRHFQSLPPEG